ncbi:hypothetical protein ACFY19_20685 [Streptosporangium saharense]|uniref:hypothetical protein n=1 Tax=Streptosporangium saharense TaxID=1706840 RepID=UPI0036A8A564
MASGLYISSLADVLGTAQLALDWEAETHQWALYSTTRVPDYNSDTTYTATGEIVGTGYTARGKVVTGTALSKPGAGVLKYSTDAVQWPGSTLTGVRMVDMFAEAVAGDPLMLGVDLGTAYNTSDGSLLVTPHALGLLTIDGTP